MIPDNSLSSRTIRSRYLVPDNRIAATLVEDYERGGLAIQDTSKGFDYQNWYGLWDKNDNNIYLTPDDTKEPVYLFTQLNVFEFSFAFDQNMRYLTGVLLRDGTFLLRWYDSSVASYVTSTFSGITGFKLGLDDKREVQVRRNVTDVIFTYLKDNLLCFRSQRERFATEHVLKSDLPLNLVITNFGMNEHLRVQWRMRYRLLEEKLPWRL